jgi:hypothetical protein
METPPMPLQLFNLREGSVSGTANQTVVDAFAADFQGLKHFGTKLGDVLGVGAPWTGALQEEDFTLSFVHFNAGTGALDAGAGAMIGEKRSLLDMLNRISEREF